jgi:hypothetical protein
VRPAVGLQDSDLRHGEEPVNPSTSQDTNEASEQERAVAQQAQAAATTVPEVVSALEQLQELHEQIGTPPRQDGVGRFNALYTQITQAVLATITAGGFTDNDFVGELDVAFAHRYFTALANPDQAARCWALLIERRDNPRISEIHFAAAGVNAPNNYDLPAALVTACRDNDRRLDDAGLRESYQQVNQIFYQKMNELIAEFKKPGASLAPRVVDDAEDRAGDLTVDLTRDVALDHAERLAPLAGPEADRYEKELDRLTSLAARGILFVDP